jgi:hypothetical protein
MTTTSAKQDAESESPHDAATQSCAHHWLLDEPAEGHVFGCCKRCGEERQFPGSPDGTRRFDDFQELTSTTAYYREATSG